ncbi:MAG: LysR family transcriptional regulator [Promethearchaeota archaeon]|nr:MAG: LysR family transcriptional regulator [Candidatus Lokiarchaeota archaeon]
MLASDLSISQSTISHQISQLESELGTKLIERTTKTFKITEVGKILLDYGERIINLFDSCKQDISGYVKNQVENIIITASNFPGSHLLPKNIAKFKEQNPNVNFNIIINNSRESIQILKNKKADFAGIGIFMNYNKDDFEILKIGEDKLVFVCSPNHELIKGSIDLDDLVKYPYISRERGSGTRNTIENDFADYKKLNLKLEINDNDSIISAVSESNYIAILSEFIAEKAENAGLIKILKIKDNPVITKRKIYFIKLKDKKIKAPVPTNISSHPSPSKSIG